MKVKEIVLGIAINRKTNKKELVILDKTGKEYTVDIEKLKEHTENYFYDDFEFLKEWYFLDELNQRLNVSLDELYKIVKTDLFIAAINELIFDKEGKGHIYFLDSIGLYEIYKEIFNGNLDLETFRRVLLEMLMRIHYIYGLMDAFNEIEQIKQFINNKKL